MLKLCSAVAVALIMGASFAPSTAEAGRKTGTWKYGAPGYYGPRTGYHHGPRPGYGYGRPPYGHAYGHRGYPGRGYGYGRPYGARPY